MLELMALKVLWVFLERLAQSGLRVTKVLSENPEIR